MDKTGIDFIGSNFIQSTEIVVGNNHYDGNRQQFEQQFEGHQQLGISAEEGISFMKKFHVLHLLMEDYHKPLF